MHGATPEIEMRLYNIIMPKEFHCTALLRYLADRTVRCSIIVLLYYALLELKWLYVKYFRH